MVRIPAPFAVPRARLCAALGLLLWCIPAGAAEPKGGAGTSVADPDLLRVKGANPYLSLLPVEAEPDWEYWRARMSYEAALHRLAGGVPAVTVLVTESEAPGVLGENDLPLFAEDVPGFGSRAGQTAAAEISGHLLPLRQAAGGPFAEDDGSIPLAHTLAVPAGTTVTADGILGDGPYGSAGTGSGDFDFYAFSAAAGERIEVAVVTPIPLGDLDPVAALYKSDGTLLAVNDDIPIPGFLTTYDSYLSFTATETGTYYALVGGWAPYDGAETDLLPADPFDAASGAGAGSEGSYDVVIAVDAPELPDVDFYRVELRAGDVLGATVAGGARRVSLLTLGEELRVVAADDLSGLYPVASPLGGGGREALAYVAEEAGIYAVGVEGPIGLSGLGDGAYTLELRVARPALDRESADAVQVLFLDFDGATFDANIFLPYLGTVTLSPLADFLGRWGLSAADEDRVVDAILRTVAENLSEDLRARGQNGDFAASGVPGEFDVEIRNSRDDPDPWGEPNVSRILVGGTVDELGLRLLGIAESIDPGNFSTTETGVVLLDFLSAGAGDPNSLNSFPLAPGASKVDLIGAGVGNIVSHEAGHLFGNFHTDRDFETGGTANVMDRIDLVGLLVGPGGVFGDADDQDVDFGPDAYSRFEPFAGTEETLQTISFGLPRGGGRADAAIDRYAHDFGALPLGSSVAASFLLTNEGTLDLEFFGAALSGSGDFALTAGGGAATLPPGTSRTLEVTFSPTAGGEMDALLSLATNDGDEDPLRVTLHGYGGVGDIDIDATAHDFGELGYGDASTSASHTFILRNTDPGAELYVTAMRFTGADPAAFVVEGATERVLAPASETPLVVRFAPGGLVGDRSARLRIVSSDVDESPLDVFLSGSAAGPDLAVSPPSPYIYGLWGIGFGWRRDFLVTNAGSRDLVVTAVTLTGDADFEITQGGGPFVLPPGGLHAVRVEFVAAARGTREAVLGIVSNDPDESPLTIELVGVGGVAELVAEPDVCLFAAVPRGESATRSCRIRNVGNYTFRGTAEIVGAAAGDFSLASGGGQILINPEDAVDLDVRFTPSGEGTRLATMRLVHARPNQPTLEVPLAGLGGVEVPTLSSWGLLLLAAAVALFGVLKLRRL